MEDKPKKRGRPPAEEGAEMMDVTLRVRKSLIQQVDNLILPNADDWPEFMAHQNPTRAVVLKLAMAIGLNELKKRL